MTRRPGFGRLAGAVTIGILAVTVPRAASAQLEISGQLDLVGMLDRDSLGLNSAFRGDNPFNPVRLRVFASKWITQRVGVFSEFLYDIDSSPRMNGAYVVVNELGGQRWLNGRFGLAPNAVGSFGMRSTYFNANPVIGVPLLWQHRTNLSKQGTETAADLAGGGEVGRGVPILYDSCWNIQWELLGEVGAFEYSVGLTPGSQSNPGGARAIDGSQWLVRLGHTPFAGLRLGLSAASGPYLSPPGRDSTGELPYGADPASFDQTLIGTDVEYSGGPFLFHSEVFASRWEAPLVGDPLESIGGYAELRYDVSTGWYVAGRVGGLFFNDIETDPESGARAQWDQDTYRTEFAVGYRMSREVLVKLDWQRTANRDSAFAQNLFAVQLSSVF